LSVRQYTPKIKSGIEHALKVQHLHSSLFKQATIAQLPKLPKLYGIKPLSKKQTEIEQIFKVQSLLPKNAINQAFKNPNNQTLKNVFEQV